jgi:hypothetical protein
MSIVLTRVFQQPARTRRVPGSGAVWLLSSTSGGNIRLASCRASCTTAPWCVPRSQRFNRLTTRCGPGSSTCGGWSAPPLNPGLVNESSRGQRHVCFPTVGADNGSRLDSLLDTWNQDISADIRDPLEPDPSEAARLANRDRNRQDRLGLGLTATHALFFATDAGLIHFHPAHGAIAAGTDHGSPQLVKHGPGRLIASEPQHALETEGTHSVLLAGELPHSREPSGQWRSRALEDRASRDRGLVPAGLTRQPPPRRPVRFADRATGGTPETVAPPQALQVRRASALVREPSARTGSMYGGSPPPPPGGTGAAARRQVNALTGC